MIFKAPAGLHQARWMAKTIYRSEEHTSELQSLITISYAVFCLKKKKDTQLINGKGRYVDDLQSPGFLHAAFLRSYLAYFFFFNDTATTEIYTVMNTLSLHDALPISGGESQRARLATHLGTG